MSVYVNKSIDQQVNFQSIKIAFLFFNFEQSTKGHSALKRWSYAPQSRSALYEDTFIPEVIRPRSYYGKFNSVLQHHPALPRH